MIDLGAFFNLSLLSGCCRHFGQLEGNKENTIEKFGRVSPPYLDSRLLDGAFDPSSDQSLHRSYQ